MIVAIDGPPKAELVQGLKARVGLRCGGGHGFGICVPEPQGEQDVLLRVHLDPEIRLGVEARCADGSPRLQVAPDQRRLAYDCGEGFQIVYLGAGGRALRGERIGGVVEFANVPTLEASQRRLFDRYGFEARQLLLAEIQERGGNAALIDLLAVTANRVATGLHHQRKKGGAWQAVTDALPAPERARLLQRLERDHPEAARPDASPAPWDAQKSLEDPDSELIRRIQRLRAQGR